MLYPRLSVKSMVAPFFELRSTDSISLPKISYIINMSLVCMGFANSILTVAALLNGFGLIVIDAPSYISLIPVLFNMVTELHAEHPLESVTQTV